MIYYIAVFKTKNNAMNMFFTLEKKGITSIELISTPLKISGGCSFSIKFTDLNKLEYFEQINPNLENELKGVYIVEKLNKEKKYKKLNEII